MAPDAIGPVLAPIDDCGRSSQNRTMEAATNTAAQRRTLILRTIYALCLLGATYNHWAVIVQHGFLWDYGGVSRASATFWTALAFLDPAAVILLFARPKVGVAATAAIIITDVIHNVWILAGAFPPPVQTLTDAPQVMAQIAFMTFVIITAPFAWNASRRPDG